MGCTCTCLAWGRSTGPAATTATRSWIRRSRRRRWWRWSKGFIEICCYSERSSRIMYLKQKKLYNHNNSKTPRKNCDSKSFVKKRYLIALVFIKNPKFLDEWRFFYYFDRCSLDREYESLCKLYNIDHFKCFLSKSQAASKKKKD